MIDMLVDAEVSFGWTLTNSALGLTSVILLYWLSTRNHNHWTKHGVPYVKPIPILGTLYQMLIKPAHEVEKSNYFKYGQIYGYYEGNKPCLSVADPELLRDIFIKSFANFSTRREIPSGNEIFMNMVGIMKGDDNWRRIRAIISPTFSTGKIKRMLNIFKDCSRIVVKNFHNASIAGRPIDAKKFFGAYTMDVVVNSAFSTKIDSHNDPNNPFVTNATKAFQSQCDWKLLLCVCFPQLTKLFNFSFFPPEVMEFYRQVTVQIIEERKKTGQVWNDFLQILIDAKKGVEDNDESALQHQETDVASNYGMQEEINPHTFKNVTSKKLSMDELVAQCVVFFIAGYDTTASTLAFATYLLALNPRIQDTQRAKIDEALEDSKGELTYDALQRMTYLDNVISETLRLYPPFIRTDRTAEEDYLLGNTGIKILKGMSMSIPIYAIHRDPKVYPDPEQFDPDRFTPEEKAKRDPYSYLPFGAGPRNCVAWKFALMEIKVCLAYVVANFYIKRCPQTKVNFDVCQIVIQPKGIILQMESRKESLRLI